MAEPSKPAEALRRIADERLEKGSRDWAEVHRISGYIEGVEEVNRILSEQLEAFAKRLSIYETH